MTAGHMMMMEEAAMPRLARGVRLKFDQARDCWVVLAPERVIMPDETALEILRRCDGETSLGAIIDALAADYDAGRETIAADVQALMAELRRNGILSP
jgi:pyrroloquinoline quinone biosynthesis protein D